MTYQVMLAMKLVYNDTIIYHKIKNITDCHHAVTVRSGQIKYMVKRVVTIL